MIFRRLRSGSLISLRSSPSVDTGPSTPPDTSPSMTAVMISSQDPPPEIWVMLVQS
jgi:hypothetical protein